MMNFKKAYNHVNMEFLDLRLMEGKILASSEECG